MKYKTIFAAGLARKLIKDGFIVIDIKPNNRNEDKTVFIFEKTDEFERAMDKHIGK